MFGKVTAVAALAMLVVGVPAVAGDDDAKDDAKKDVKICKTERATGSLARRTKICLTREEWRELNAKTKKQIDDYSSTQTSVRQGAGQAQ